MANTSYVLIDKITVGAAGASSVTFSGIPQTGYTDLVVKITGRSNRAAVQDYVKTSFNGVTANLSMRQLYTNGGSPASSTETEIYTPGLPGASATANTFGNVEIYIPNYTSSNYKSVSIDGVLENNDTGSYLALDAGSNTAAITSVVLTPYFGSFVQYSTFYLYGVAKLGTTPAIFPKASGGDTIMTDGTYWYHAFLSSGTFTPASALTCDVLVVAGGGGGGTGGIAGGAGAGGFLVTTSQSLASGTGYTATIGAGGVGTTVEANVTSGSNSQFGSITASVGGGRGGCGNSPLSSANGGSSGGIRNVVGNGGRTIGTATSGQGNIGGQGTGSTDSGGGGGASAVGSNGTGGTQAGAGGAGTNSYSTWASATLTGVSGYYAGGGGGGGYSPAPSVAAGAGGAGGGGAGGAGSAATAGTANTGGGGGGGGAASSGSGGSGIVIVRYAV